MGTIIAVPLILLGLAVIFPIVRFGFFIVFWIFLKLYYVLGTSVERWVENDQYERLHHPEPNILPPLPPRPPPKPKPVKPDMTREELIAILYPGGLVEEPETLTPKQRAAKMTAMRKKWEAEGHTTGLLNQETGEVYDPK